MATIVPTTYSNNLSTSIGSISAGDDIIIQDSSINFTAGLDLSANEIDTFAVAPTCTSSFGSPGSGGVLLNLSAATYTGLLDYNGRGASAYFDPATAIARTIIRGTGGGTFYGLGGTWAQIEQETGYSRFNTSADVQILYMTGGSSFVDTHASDTIDTAVIDAAASLIFKRTVGALTVRGKAVMDERSPTCTTATIQGEGVLVWAGGAITNAVLSDRSVLDLSMLSGNLTITNLTKYGNSCRIIKPAGSFTLTVTNETLIGGATSEK